MAETDVAEIGYLEDDGTPVLIYSSGTKTKSLVELWFHNITSSTQILRLFLNGTTLLHRLLGGDSGIQMLAEEIVLVNLLLGPNDLLYAECGTASASSLTYKVFTVTED